MSPRFSFSPKAVPSKSIQTDLSIATTPPPRQDSDTPTPTSNACAGGLVSPIEEAKEASAQFEIDKEKRDQFEKDIQSFFENTIKIRSIYPKFNEASEAVLQVLRDKATLLLNTDLTKLSPDDAIAKQFKVATESLAYNKFVLAEADDHTSLFHNFYLFMVMGKSKYAVEFKTAIFNLNQLINNQHALVSKHKAVPQKTFGITWDKPKINSEHATTLGKMIDVFKSYYTGSNSKLHFNRHHAKDAMALVSLLEKTTDLQVAKQHIDNLKRNMIVADKDKGSLPWTRFFGGSTFFNRLTMAENLLQEAQRQQPSPKSRPTL